MVGAGKAVFDAPVFLAKVGAGKAVLEFHKNQNVFAQGDVADTVFYIQKGKVKMTVLSELGKEAVVGILEPGRFFGEHEWPQVTHFDGNGDGKLCHHGNHERRDAGSPS